MQKLPEAALPFQRSKTNTNPPFTLLDFPVLGGGKGKEGVCIIQWMNPLDNDTLTFY